MSDKGRVSTVCTGHEGTHLHESYIVGCDLFLFGTPVVLLLPEQTIQYNEIVKIIHISCKVISKIIIPYILYVFFKCSLAESAWGGSGLKSIIARVISG